MTKEKTVGLTVQAHGLDEKKSSAHVNRG